MTRKELMKLSQRELFKACRNQGLDCSGSKVDLVDRLVEDEEAPALVEPEPEVEPKVSAPESEAESEPAVEPPPEE